MTMIGTMTARRAAWLLVVMAPTLAWAGDGTDWSQAGQRLPTFTWQAAHSIPLAGAVLHLMAFQVGRVLPAEAAQRLQTAWPVLDRALFSTQWVVLSGLGDAGARAGPCQPQGQEAHWLAELYPAQAGTSGRLSVLCLDAQSSIDINLLDREQP